MIPPRNFPESHISLVELREKQVIKTHAKLPSTTRNRYRLQNMRNDLLMVDPKLDLQILENNE